MNKHTQNLEEQIKALSIENTRLKKIELDYEEVISVNERKDSEIRDLKMQLSLNNKTMKDKQQYNGWVVSDNIIKRALAIWAHALLGYMLFAIIVALIMIPVTILIELSV